ncbi:uncharacterized protein A4U43_C05F28960 [Asparagus officinalis]|uniref:Uncharacterized protein n=1 Tax=Asparagus officinalis TaxID=4686 RepID=A0A5P1F0M8_ASPOF|nr:uncharacterized protein LOC109840807 isoform X2 [Asparagus officinalis]ONK69980.1 uncharacterized protein A4U43_C05F28960 [Asparagus officinalis]
MQQLTRKWWKRGRRGRSEGGDGDGDRDRFSLPTRDEFQPIDSQEQEEMVRAFEKTHAHQSRLWRSVFGGFLLGYVAFLIYSIFQQSFYPWELRYHAYFMDEIHPWMVITADWVAVLACLLAVKGLLQSSTSYQKWMWYSCYTGLLLACFWLYYMMRLPTFRWDIIWLPFGPFSGAGVCLYVDHLLEEALQDIKKLRGCMYTFKAM